MREFGRPTVTFLLPAPSPFPVAFSFPKHLYLLSFLMDIALRLTSRTHLASALLALSTFITLCFSFALIPVDFVADEGFGDILQV
jgi:hypothetical protein